MENYVASLEEIKDIWKADRDEYLTKAELKIFRKMTGKLSELANSTHPDLSYTALTMLCSSSLGRYYLLASSTYKSFF